MEIFNHVNKNETNTLISFINTKNTIVEKIIFYVEFENGKTKMVLDNLGYLTNLSLKHRNNKNILKYTDNYIKNIACIKRYYSFIKILDNSNEDLNGKVMVLYYGRTIKKMLDEYLKNNNKISNMFRIIKDMNLQNPYASYDDSFFTSQEYEVDDYSLDMENELKFQTIELPYILLRKDKLNKIKEKICLKKGML